MALMSKALAKAFSCHLPLPRFEFNRACDKVSSDLVVFAGYSCFLHPLEHFTPYLEGTFVMLKCVCQYKTFQARCTLYNLT